MISSTNEPSMDTLIPVKQKASLSSLRDTENMRSNWYFGVILLMCALSIWLFARIYHEAVISFDQSGALTVMEYSWLVRLCLNLAGYATVLLPCLLLYKYLQRINYFDKFPSRSLMSRAMFACFGEPAERLPEAAPPSPSPLAAPPPSARREGLELAFCSGGLMLTYLLWGLLQEKLMTQSYLLPDGSVMKFTDSQFLVFINRLAAFLLSLSYLMCTSGTVAVVPLYKYSYCALSNVISAWCQYEALKYLSFPTQVLSKSCKVVPVMLMGALVSRRSYSSLEVCTAGGVCAGMLLFMTATAHHQQAWMVSSWSGGALLALYLASDSFTSTWQERLLRQYRPACRPTHMVCGVSAWSCALTLASLWHQPGLADHVRLAQNGMFVLDCAVLCACSAGGQLLIYRTIAKFGAVVFVIIMTCRQAVSILLSCLVYGHRISPSGVVGIMLVFASVAVRIYYRHRTRRPNI